jgi:hypothetical protein
MDPDSQQTIGLNSVKEEFSRLGAFRSPGMKTWMNGVGAAAAAPLQSIFTQRRPAQLRSCPVVCNASKEHASAANLLWICKTNLAGVLLAFVPHEAKDSALGIVFHAVAGVKQAGQKAVCTVLRAFEIEHVKLVARFEDAPRRTQRLPFFVGAPCFDHL